MMSNQLNYRYGAEMPLKETAEPLHYFGAGPWTHIFP